MGQTSSHPVSLPPSHFLPIEHHALSDPTTTIAAPPPGCPMHKPTPPPTPPPSCPMHDPSKLKPSTPPPASCPIDHKSLNADLNPLNQMPELSQSPLSDAQRLTLSTDREVSTIPRTLTSDEDPSIDPSSQKWVYPSAQQFYNALVRKGQEAPEEDIESMVFVHNVLNELAWKEVLRWEGRRLGLPEGEYPEVELMRFKGRPSTLSPKAKAYLYLGYFFPESYNTEPPFDRHDWIVRRPATSTEHRYIIDYYSAPDDPDGSPNFNLDIRPALDDLGSVKDRVSAFLDDWQNGKL